MQAHSFGNWLKTRRKTRDLTQSGLADQVGCSAAAIRKIEAEERRPSAQIVERLAEIFEVPRGERAAFLRFARGEVRSAPVDTKEDFPWQKSVTSPRSNLPATVTSLIGREKTVDEVHSLLLQPEIRLVTLIGPPGIGKTRMSIESARTALPDFSDGVFFVALAPLDDPSLITLTVAQALGFVETNRQSDAKQLAEGIRDKQTLLVLDNCEHLIEDVAQLASFLLSTCSRLKILTTSRESLRVPGEWLYPVPGFDLPAEFPAIDMVSGGNFPALTLFAERARAVRPDFVLTAENIHTVSAICAHLDGLPLVIELIAARMRLMSPESLLARLNKGFILSADGLRSATARQRTLNDAIGWSYNLLSEEEQKLFAFLSVFSGGFTLDMADAIFSGAVTGKSVPNLIALLLDKSLLQRSSDYEVRGETRYSMLVTIQEFARERLREMGLDTQVRNWHLTYFLDLAEQADQEIHGPSQADWIDHLEFERDNFRVALDWSIFSQQTDLAIRLLNALCWPSLVRTHFSETHNWFDRVCHLPNLVAYPALHARLLNFMGRMTWLSGDYRASLSFLGEAQAIWLSLGVAGERGLAETLDFQGLNVFSSNNDLQQAESLFTESLNLHQKNQDQWGIAFVRCHLGMIALSRNENSLALTFLEQSMDLFHQLGDLWGKSRVSHLLGELSLKEGDYPKALSYFQQNLEFDEEIKFRAGIVVALSSLGDLHRYRRDYVQAKQYYERSLDVSSTYGMKEDWGLGLYFLGMIALHQNDYSTASRYFADHFKAERESFNKESASLLFLSQAAISAGTNQPERAAKLSGAFNSLDHKISPFNQAEFDRHIQIAREQLGESTFQELHAVGRAMTMEQAVAYAIEEQE